MFLYRLNLTGAEAGQLITSPLGEKGVFGGNKWVFDNRKKGDFKLKNVVFGSFGQKRSYHLRIICKTRYKSDFSFINGQTHVAGLLQTVFSSLNGLHGCFYQIIGLFW